MFYQVNYHVRYEFLPLSKRKSSNCCLEPLREARSPPALGSIYNLRDSSCGLVEKFITEQGQLQSLESIAVKTRRLLQVKDSKDNFF